MTAISILALVLSVAALGATIREERRHRRSVARIRQFLAELSGKE